jgi:hypothetical protein
MLTDTEIKTKGFRILVKVLGDVDAEKFIRLISKEPFDYTHWQKDLWEDESVEKVSENAMKYISKKK